MTFTDISPDESAPDELRLRDGVPVLGERGGPDSILPPEDEIEVEVGETNVKSFDDTVKGWFKFVQTEDGSVPAVYHANDEDSDIVNFKKAIAAAFQANFKGTESKVESDPQSLHLARYT